MPRFQFLSPRIRRVALPAACLLPALLQMSLAGYDLGAGNQTIQIPFLKRLADPGLFPRDLMVNTTLGTYPSVFFRILAPMLSLMRLDALYFVLHLATAAAVFGGLIALARAMFERTGPGIVAGIMILAGHHRALAGDVLYSTGFTPTGMALPLALFTLVLFYRGWHLSAFVGAGIVFDVHALTGGYVFLFLAAGVLANSRETGWRNIVLYFTCFCAASLPVLPAIFGAPPAGPGWTDILMLRSGHQILPGNAWRDGNPDIPRLALILGLAVLALSHPAPAVPRRTTFSFGITALILLAIGAAAAEFVPIPTLLKAQLLRSSRLLLVLALLVIANGIWRGWRRPFETSPGIPKWTRWIAFAAATLLAVLALPSLLPCLPVVFAAAVMAMLAAGRISVPQAIVTAGAASIVLAAHMTIHFPLAANPGRLLPRLAGVPMPSPRDDPWTDLQRWINAHTPLDALVLTPPHPGGFRIHSDRSVVAEWRDGTQMFFNPAFGTLWRDRMKALGADPRGGIAAGERPIHERKDPEILALARRFGATHIVLPARDGPPRRMRRLYTNGTWAVYLPEITSAPPPAGPPPPHGVIDGARWREEERFFQTVVLGNIEKHRKGDVTLRLLAEDGRPLQDAAWEIRQVRNSFSFSCSLPFFVTPKKKGARHGDYMPPPVREGQLAKFLEVFNASLIPFSGKWFYIEPEDGVREYEDLDKYVDWCARNGITMEYHFVSGYAPDWLNALPPLEKTKRFEQHAADLIARYGRRIRYWQVVNEKNLLHESPPVFARFRKDAPEAKLGWSDCARFWSPEKSPRRERDILRGMDALKWLKSKGVTPDFFGFHGHRPFGLWADSREIYEAFDAFAKEGVKVHVTEFATEENHAIEGPLRTGKFSPELQAEYYARLFTITYSHPAVELVNLWGIGPENWIAGSGLLDKNLQPKPAFQALKKLLRETWMTNVSGRTGLDGMISFRGFHGDYAISAALPSGEILKGTFAVTPGAPGQWVLRRNDGALTATP